ncbi:helix-turn-helix domain-containing protein [Amycolatopsis arida]|uniref:helix-turn-helix domain-containing protein n=1 Tax=Amycolatopsis arida TaxID=587909 RepID=UPI001065FA1E|nr:helix-turn-helix transcriptional regulator [Amycolatopsis arida]
MSIDEAHIGRRVREIRAWREMSLAEVAGLAGITAAYLSMIERGQRSVTKKQTVHALADALRVAPSELLADPVPHADPVTSDAHGHIEHIGIVLAHNRLGAPYREHARPWPEIQADLDTLLRDLVPACDYVAQAAMLPDLIEDLYAAHAMDSGHRREALIGLMYVLQHGAALLKNLGAHGMPYLAAMHMRYVAEELGEPAWIGAADWRVGQSSAGDRQRMLTVSLRAADALSGQTAPEARQVYGMLHLNAALASATLGKPDDALAHLAEANEMVAATAGFDGDFVDMHFGETNWGIWRVAVGVELGEGPKLTEHARSVDVSAIPAAERRGMFYGDLARGLAQDRSRRDDAIEMLRRAEDEAPQRIRSNPYVRETVADLLRQARREAGSRELRGLAWRLGLAPAG